MECAESESGGLILDPAEERSQAGENTLHNRVNEVEVLEFTTHLTPSLPYFTQPLLVEDRRAQLRFSSLQTDFELPTRSRCVPSKHVSELKKTVEPKPAFPFGRSRCPQRNTCFPLASSSLCPSGSLRNPRIGEKRTLFLISAKLHLVIQSRF